MSRPRPSLAPASARCGWCGSDPLYVAYHDQEWGVPEYNSQALFAKLTLDGFQAGLSWLTILRRRAGILAAFDGLDPERLARYDADRQAALLQDPRMIRHRGKVAAAVGNARALLRLRDRGQDFASLLWAHVGGHPLATSRRRPSDVPTTTARSAAMARALAGHGFTFCGPTICYAFMQATGMVNDHLLRCFRRAEVAGGGGPRPSGTATSKS